jgi:exodeoxyribonuclease VII large subunit
MPIDAFDRISDLPRITDPERVYAIGEITDLVKGTLEESIGTVWVEGELSNYKHHSSGHRYFSLKDESASLRGVMWRQVGRALGFEPADGMRVRAYGKITVYPPQGTYQLVVSRLEAIGVGPLEVAFRKLKEKLQAEGLFDEEFKRPLPEFPEVVGVVTSATGAAFADITETIRAQFRGMKIVLCPARVQGQGAANEIADAIATLNRREDVAVIIAGRGGGSLEDLWPFNEEVTARAIFDSRIPIISAVGHEVDFTIADGVADYRAATPTSAARAVTEGWARATEELPVLSDRLQRAVTGQCAQYRLHLDRLRQSHALRRPADLVGVWSQRLDDTSDRAQRALVQSLRRTGERLQARTDALRALSPEAVLERGYSITRLKGQTKTLRDASALQSGSVLETRLARGTVISEVRDTEE